VTVTDRRAARHCGLAPSLICRLLVQQHPRVDPLAKHHLAVVEQPGMQSLEHRAHHMQHHTYVRPGQWRGGIARPAAFSSRLRLGLWAASFIRRCVAHLQIGVGPLGRGGARRQALKVTAEGDVIKPRSSGPQRSRSGRARRDPSTSADTAAPLCGRSRLLAFGQSLRARTGATRHLIGARARGQHARRDAGIPRRPRRLYLAPRSVAQLLGLDFLKWHGLLPNWSNGMDNSEGRKALAVYGPMHDLDPGGFCAGTFVEVRGPAHLARP